MVSYLLRHARLRGLNAECAAHRRNRRRLHHGLPQLLEERSERAPDTGAGAAADHAATAATDNTAAAAPAAFAAAAAARAVSPVHHAALQPVAIADAARAATGNLKPCPFGIGFQVVRREETPQFSRVPKCRGALVIETKT